VGDRPDLDITRLCYVTYNGQYRLRLIFAYDVGMGGERSSSTRMRLAGKVCCWCRRPLEPPYPGRERACERCGGERTRRVQMRFEECHGWRVTFRDPGDLRARFRELTFTDKEKVQLLVERTGMRLLLEDRQALEHGLRNGTGGVMLVLTEEQYRKLLR
jgi:hypothetical protein